MSFFFTIFLFLLLMVVVLFFWIRERRYLKKKTSEAMSEGLWNEVIHEREEVLEKRRHFRDTLEQAKKKSD